MSWTELLLETFKNVGVRLGAGSLQGTAPNPTLARLAGLNFLAPRDGVRESEELVLASSYLDTS